MPVPWAIEMGVDSVGRKGGGWDGHPTPRAVGMTNLPPHSTPEALTCPCRSQA